MADTTLPGVLLKGVAGSRPAASAVASGTIYSATDTGAITQSDGVSTWSTFATISAGSVATDAIWDTAGDIVQGTGANTAAKLALGTASQQLRVNAGATALEYFTPSSSAFVGARVYNTGNESINDVTATALTFDSERYDTSTFHDTGSNTSRLTVGTTGYYRIGATIEWAANATGYRQMGFRLGGTTYLAFQVSQNVGASQETRMALTTDYALTATNYIEIMVAQNSGGALNVVAGASYSPEFYIQYLGS